jgi:hypothetical protein
MPRTPRTYLLRLARRRDVPGGMNVLAGHSPQPLQEGKFFRRKRNNMPQDDLLCFLYVDHASRTPLRDALYQKCITLRNLHEGNSVRDRTRRYVLSSGRFVRR